nr:hypothetical protein [Tanacetum cinerariifolium]
WSSISLKKTNDVVRLQALIDRRKVSITEDTVRQALRLDDTDSIDCLPNEEIFADLARMGYEKPSTKLTFYKAFFSPQWKFLIHTILQCMSAKRTAWNEFSSSMASDVICLAIEDDDAAEPTPPSSTPATTPSPPQQELISSPPQVVPTSPPSPHQSPIAQPSSPSQQQPSQPSHTTDIFMDLLNTLLETCTTLTRKVENLEQDKITQGLEIMKLKQRVKRLEQKRKLKVLGFKRLGKVGTAQTIESSADTIMDDKEDASKHKRKIVEIDAYEDVTLEKVDAEVQGRLEESQAQVYYLDLIHTQKVLSMQDDKAEPAELEEVIEVVTTAKLMTKVVTAALLPKANQTRRRRAVIIHDLEETATLSVIVHSEPTSKEKRKEIVVEEPKPLKRQAHIKQDEAYAKELEAELNASINWNKARKNMMVYLKNMAGFKMDFFKGMSYTDIRPIFKKHFNSIVAFLEKGKEELEEEASKQGKRKSKSSEQQAAKKQRIDEEIEELKTHLQIVPNDEDDVYTKATLIALKIWISAKVKSWKLLESCGVHIITFISTQMIMLVERRYPLTRFTLDQMLNNVRLKVEEESEVSLELLRFLRLLEESAAADEKMKNYTKHTAAAINVQKKAHRISTTRKCQCKIKASCPGCLFCVGVSSGGHGESWVRWRVARIVGRMQLQVRRETRV